MVCGVTLLEVEHREWLGDTIEQIAWHKSGIFKPGAIAVTIQQTAEAMQVLQQRARERSVSFIICFSLQYHHL